MPDYLTICEKAARAGGDLLLEWQDRFHVREKAPSDLVTEADFESQAAIRKIVLGAFPTHGFVGEEDTSADSAAPPVAGGFRWIVDPLDGTTNYVHGLPNFCVSVALEKAGEMVVGTILDPVSGNCFSAERGAGAFLNGKRLRTSEVQSLSNALVAVSLPAGTKAESPDIPILLAMIERSQAFRRMGAAALNLAYLAAGWLDVYWVGNVQIWDVAAGILIVREAGGVITSQNGRPFDVDNPTLLAAANTALHDDALTILGDLSGIPHDTNPRSN